MSSTAIIGDYDTWELIKARLSSLIWLTSRIDWVGLKIKPLEFFCIEEGTSLAYVLAFYATLPTS